MSASRSTTNSHPSPHISSGQSLSVRNLQRIQGDDDDGESNQPEESLICSEVYLALLWHSGQLGAVYYDLTSMQLHVMPDALETDDFSLSKQIVREIQPSAIVVSSIQDGRLIQCLKKLDSNSSSPGSRSQPLKIEFLPSSDFNYEVSKRRILGIHLPSVPNHFTDEEKKLHFASLIPMDQTNMVRAVGGLCKYLERNRVGVELEDAFNPVPILGFKIFTLESQIHIDLLTYTALKIFDTEVHPSVYKQGGGSGKEGLSLFGILNRCKSSIGSRMLRQWFLRPVKNAALLRQRHDAIAYFLAPRNKDTLTFLQGCLKHIKYLPKILWRMSKAQATVTDLVALYKTIHHAVYIRNISREQHQSVEIFRKIATTFTEDLHRCASLIDRMIDFDESRKLKKFVVKPNVDEKLDAKKRLHQGIPDILNKVAAEELESLDSGISQCSATYYPQLGYLLVIDMPDGATEDDDHPIDGLQFVFASNGQLYYKSARTRELDTRLGDILLEILDMEVDILHRLQSEILESTQVLLAVMDMAAELDCLMALAACASEFCYVRPNLVQEHVIDIKGGRHPLQELCSSPYVPNPTLIGGPSARIKLLTGPNACGKSVYLKQVALIVFMSHIGSFVPAESAYIGPVDKFFSRIKSGESVSNGLSTFLQDSMQMSGALSGATQKSLVIVDEFGKGTESTDGLALLTAILKFWMSKGGASPYVLVSTHYHSIIHQKLLPQSTLVQFLTLDTVMNGSEPVFLYQLKEGHASSSHACHIAAQVGIPQPVIKRGQEVSELLSQYKQVPHMKDGGFESQSKRHQDIVDGFMQLDLEKDNLVTFLKTFVLQPASTFSKTDIIALRHGKSHKENPSINQEKPNFHRVDRLSCKRDNRADQNKDKSLMISGKESQQAQSKGQGAGVDKTIPSLLSNGWTSDNVGDLIQKKRAAILTLDTHGLGKAAEHFTKTPLLGRSDKRNGGAMTPQHDLPTAKKRNHLTETSSLNTTPELRQVGRKPEMGEPSRYGNLLPGIQKLTKGSETFSDKVKLLEKSIIYEKPTKTSSPNSVPSNTGRNKLTTDSSPDKIACVAGRKELTTDSSPDRVSFMARRKELTTDSSPDRITFMTKRKELITDSSLERIACVAGRKERSTDSSPDRIVFMAGRKELTTDSSPDRITFMTTRKELITDSSPERIGFAAGRKDSTVELMPPKSSWCPIKRQENTKENINRLGKFRDDEIAADNGALDRASQGVNKRKETMSDSSPDRGQYLIQNNRLENSIITTPDQYSDLTKRKDGPSSYFAPYASSSEPSHPANTVKRKITIGDLNCSRDSTEENIKKRNMHKSSSSNLSSVSEPNTSRHGSKGGYASGSSSSTTTSCPDEKQAARSLESPLEVTKQAT